MVLILSLLTACSLFNSPPVADFFVSPDSGSAPLVVSFDASSSSDTDGIIVAYRWEFGDGTTGSGKVKTHTYELPGEYIARLTVTDDDGAKDLTIQTIQVDEASLTARFTGSPTSGEAPLSVDFDASGSFDPGGESITYAWSFGDGSTGAGVVARHTYYTVGIYTVLLTVSNESGDEDQTTATIVVSRAPIPGNVMPNAEFTSTPNVGEAPLTVSFNASGSSDSDGYITSYQWTFGDGESGSGATTSHTYADSGTYEVWLMVADNNGATDTATTTIQATASNVPPVASFFASPTSGEAPLEVSFDASASYDPDGAIVSHGWSFGDGDNGSGASATHTYSAAGTYSAQLTVTDDDGVTDSTSRSIQVSPIPNIPPTASFTASPSSGDAPLEVSFDASASSDPDGIV
ncbi:PKD domain-containing protein, partial [Candidatus Bipolaricaulota bacterium]|nr:PKD domain-containing protein [Candidatus Bipolaricaulota bacterium]